MTLSFKIRNLVLHGVYLGMLGRKDPTQHRPITLYEINKQLKQL
jgi:3-dehydroquinate dehydratase